ITGRRIAGSPAQELGGGPSGAFRGFNLVPDVSVLLGWAVQNRRVGVREEYRNDVRVRTRFTAEVEGIGADMHASTGLESVGRGFTIRASEERLNAPAGTEVGFKLVPVEVVRRFRTIHDFRGDTSPECGQ